VTWAHALSLCRVAAAIPVAALIVGGRGSSLLWAAGLFTLASLTDLLDGPIARREQSVGPFGIYLDTTGDKVLVSIVLIALSSARLIDVWMAMLIIGREFIVTGVRTLASVEGQVITANFAGKVKTTVTLIGITVVLLVAGIREGGIGIHAHDIAIWSGVAWWIMLLAVALTVYSGLRYILDARPLFAATMRPGRPGNPSS
jgi:CDP-diacylglycerol--glycerol-3-phosphate 3-phosphatidyltransferase